MDGQISWQYESRDIKIDRVKSIRTTKFTNLLLFLQCRCLNQCFRQLHQCFLMSSPILTLCTWLLWLQTLSEESVAPLDHDQQRALKHQAKRT